MLPLANPALYNSYDPFAAAAARNVAAFATQTSTASINATATTTASKNATITGTTAVEAGEGGTSIVTTLRKQLRPDSLSPLVDNCFFRQSQ